MQYVLLLRGVNVGGKNKVVMAELKQRISDLGYTKVITYINSGNVLFHSDKAKEDIRKELEILFRYHYSFEIIFALLDEQELREENADLPDWWDGPLARSDVLFFEKDEDLQNARNSIRKMMLYKEEVYFGSKAIFWGKYDEKEFLKSAYHKSLIKESFYRQCTIRNGNTYRKILALLEENR